MKRRGAGIVAFSPLCIEVETIAFHHHPVSRMEIPFGGAYEASALIQTHSLSHHISRMQSKHRGPCTTRPPLAFIHERACHTLPARCWRNSQQAHFWPTGANFGTGIGLGQWGIEQDAPDDRPLALSNNALHWSLFVKCQK